MACLVCGNSQGLEVARSSSRHGFDCPQCGGYEVSDSAVADYAGSVRPDSRWLVSAWLQDNANELLTTDKVQEAIGAKRPGLQQRARRVLRWLSEEVGPGHYFDLHGLGVTRAESPTTSRLQSLIVHPPILRAVSIGWNRSKAETVFLIADVLGNELGYLRNTDGLYSLTAKGMLSLEAAVNEAAHIGFCAMWFNPAVQPFFTHVLEHSIAACGYEPLRIDGKEHNGKIDDEIVASIRGARFLVADFTGHRGGVYYEAGLAHGLELPVIFTCRHDAIDGLHFDVRQYNTILWRDDALGEAAERLTNRILATLGRGPR